MSVVGRLAGREAERAALRTRVAELEEAGPAAIVYSPAGMAETVDELRLAFTAGDVAAARATLAALLAKIVIFPERLGLRPEYHWL